MVTEPAADADRKAPEFNVPCPHYPTTFKPFPSFHDTSIFSKVKKLKTQRIVEIYWIV